MHLVLGGINGHYLANIGENVSAKTEEVRAAVAYATDSTLLFDWCWKNRIPLRFYGRLDETVAVALPVLRSFLQRKSPSHVCRLVTHHHAKVIWWRGAGVYIGSANLTGNAWYNNVEAGCYFEDDEITDEMAEDLTDLFSTLDRNATPLTEELLSAMEKRARILTSSKPSAEDFWKAVNAKQWSGLVHTQRGRVADRRRRAFLDEWYATLQDLRDIGTRVAANENRPSWITASSSPGAQADQFLHAYYYQRTFDGRKANFMAHYEENKKRKEEALVAAIDWWRKLPTAPQSEATMLNSTAPLLQSLLSEQALTTLSYDEFFQICERVHAIRDYARRVRNRSVGLPEVHGEHDIPLKVAALSQRIWNHQNSGGNRVKALLMHLLYGGEVDQLPERLWESFTDPVWKIDGLGVSALGELVGWAMPDRFPPRNGRTSKALKALGYDVTIHVQ